ncbi:PEGA domain-containing protein [Fibrella sp. WM1]|uniref:PEGA domain-containing protein n=1 Tax=Fibrella musci TaxID=3242485 RepID=UPI003520D7EF
MNRLLLTCLVVAFARFVSVAQTEQRGAKIGNLPADTTQYSLAYAQKYALLIGIDNYEAKSGFPALRYAAADASALAQVLITRLGYPRKNVRLLLNGAATRRNIQNALEAFTRDDMVENSQLLVFFAGHGSTTGRSGNRRRGFLVPADGNDAELNASAIAMDELRQQAEFLRPKHTLFLVDACYGGLAQSRAGIPTLAFLRNVWNQRCREIITAGSADETVLESGEWQHSAFTKVLLDAIDRGEADTNGDDVIVANELFGYVQQRVPYYAQQKGGKQTPQFSTLTPETGTFLLELRPGALLRGRNQNFVPTDTDISRKLSSRLVVTANVPTASVRVNDQEVGYLSDGRFTYSLAPGYYRVEVSKDKYDVERREIEVRPDTTLNLSVALTQRVFDVQVRTDPADALVWIDNRLLGRGDQTISLEKGRHALSVQKEGFLPDNRVLDLLNETTIPARLSPVRAAVEVLSVPAGATVMVDSVVVGRTPASFSLAYGPHLVRVQQLDYLTKDIPLDIREPTRVSQAITLAEDPNGRLMRKRIQDQLNRRMAANFGLSAISLLGYVYLNKLAADNRAESTFLTQTADRQKRGSWQVGKHVALAAGTLELIAGLLNVRKMVRFQQGRLLVRDLDDASSELRPYRWGLVTEAYSYGQFMYDQFGIGGYYGAVTYQALPTATLGLGYDYSFFTHGPTVDLRQEVTTMRLRPLLLATIGYAMNGTRQTVTSTLGIQEQVQAKPGLTYRLGVGLRSHFFARWNVGLNAGLFYKNEPGVSVSETRSGSIKLDAYENVGSLCFLLGLSF